MRAEDLCVGLIVRLPPKPEWGLGKVIELTEDRVWVYFKDILGTPKDAIKQLGRAQTQLVVGEVQTDTHLDNLPPMIHNGKIAEPEAFRMTEDQAINLFVKEYRSFEDAEYLKHERDYKWSAHLQIVKDIPSLKKARPEAAAEIIKRWIHLTNLLAVPEMIGIGDAFKNPAAAVEFGSAVVNFARVGDVTAFEELVSATSSLPAEHGRARVFTWPVLTLLPFLAAPDAAMFLKPKQTKRMATGCFFDLLYDSRPNWGTYSRLMTLSDHLLNRLRPLGARDFIDVQSFMWVVAGAHRE